MRSPVRIDSAGVYLFGLRFVRPGQVERHSLAATMLASGWYGRKTLPGGWVVFWIRRRQRREEG